MKEIFFIVEEDQDSGYTARAVGHSIFTEAETIQELKTNIKEVLECHFNILLLSYIGTYAQNEYQGSAGMSFR